MGKTTQVYSKELAAIMPGGLPQVRNVGNNKKLLKAIWKYAADNDLKIKGTVPPMVKCDALLKKLFGKDEISPIKDQILLRNNGHVKNKE